MNPPKAKLEINEGAATPVNMVVNKTAIPTVKEVSKLAVGVAAVATGSATGKNLNYFRVNSVRKSFYLNL